MLGLGKSVTRLLAHYLRALKRLLLFLEQRGTTRSLIESFAFSVQLKAAVVLSQEHPTTPPFFSVEVCCGKSVIRDSFTKVLAWNFRHFPSQL